MRIVSSVLMVALAGCSSYEPRPNDWPDQRIEPPAVSPVELPPWPDIGDDLRLTAEQAQALLDWADAAQANTEIARELAAAVEALSASHSALVDAGSAEHELAELRGRMLHEERQAGVWRQIRSGAVCVLGIVGAAQ